MLAVLEELQLLHLERARRERPHVAAVDRRGVELAEAALLGREEHLAAVAPPRGEEQRPADPGVVALREERPGAPLVGVDDEELAGVDVAAQAWTRRREPVGDQSVSRSMKRLPSSSAGATRCSAPKS
jgi:hypothetical protein